MVLSTLLVLFILMPAKQARIIMLNYEMIIMDWGVQIFWEQNRGKGGPKYLDHLVVRYYHYYMERGSKNFGPGGSKIEGSKLFVTGVN